MIISSPKLSLYYRERAIALAKAGLDLDGLSLAKKISLAKEPTKLQQPPLLTAAPASESISR
jgi:hypothetical protein